MRLITDILGALCLFVLVYALLIAGYGLGL